MQHRNHPAGVFDLLSSHLKVDLICPVSGRDFENTFKWENWTPNNISAKRLYLTNKFLFWTRTGLLLALYGTLSGDVLELDQPAQWQSIDEEGTRSVLLLLSCLCPRQDLHRAVIFYGVWIKLRSLLSCNHKIMSLWVFRVMCLIIVNKTGIHACKTYLIEKAKMFMFEICTCWSYMFIHRDLNPRPSGREVPAILATLKLTGPSSVRLINTSFSRALQCFLGFESW